MRINKKLVYFPTECFYCGIELRDKWEHTYDHIQPLAKGGKNNWENLVDCCQNCNGSKADKGLEEWYFELKKEEETLIKKEIESQNPKRIYLTKLLNKMVEILNPNQVIKNNQLPWNQIQTSNSPEEIKEQTHQNKNTMDEFMKLAILQARKSWGEGGIPIGSVLVRGEEVLAEGHNKRVQEQNPILHGEMDCLNNAGRVGSYKDTVIYSTLMPCYMCAGTIVQFNIPKVIVAESVTFKGAREFMESHGVEVVDLALPECIEMMTQFIKEKPELWFEDIGEL